MGCKKNLVWVLVFQLKHAKKNGQTSNCRRSLVSIFRYLLNVHIGLLAVVSKTDVQNQILSSSNKSKTTYLAKVGKNVHSTLLVQTKQSWKHSDVSTSPLMDAKTHPNQSTSQTLSRLPAMLSWFEIKTAPLISNQLQLKRLSSKTMSSYMTSSVLFNQMPPKWPLVQRKREFQL